MTVTVQATDQKNSLKSGNCTQKSNLCARDRIELGAMMLIAHIDTSTLSATYQSINSQSALGKIRIEFSRADAWLANAYTDAALLDPKRGSTQMN